MNHETAFARGVSDRNSGYPLIAHDDIPDGALWDSYMDGYTSVVGGPINACEAEWLLPTQDNSK